MALGKVESSRWLDRRENSGPYATFILPSVLIGPVVGPRTVARSTGYAGHCPGTPRGLEPLGAVPPAEYAEQCHRTQAAQVAAEVLN